MEKHNFTWSLAYPSLWLYCVPHRPWTSVTGTLTRSTHARGNLMVGGLTLSLAGLRFLQGAPWLTHCTHVASVRVGSSERPPLTVLLKVLLLMTLLSGLVSLQGPSHHPTLFSTCIHSLSFPRSILWVPEVSFAVVSLSLTQWQADTQVDIC